MASGAATGVLPRIIFLYDVAGEESICRAKENPPNIVGFLGSRCVVVQDRQDLILVFSSGKFEILKPEDIKGRLFFDRPLRDEMVLLTQTSPTEGASTHEIVFMNVESRKIMLQALPNGETPIEAITNRVVRYMSEGKHFFGLYYLPEGGHSASVFSQEIFDPTKDGIMLESHTCDSSLYVHIQVQEQFFLKKFRVQMGENPNSFSVPSATVPLKVKPLRMFSLEDSFMVVSKENFQKREVEENLVVTLFDSVKEGIVCRSYTTDPSVPIPFEEMTVVACDRKDVFYRVGDLHKWGLFRFCQGGKIIRIFESMGAIAATASFTDSARIAFLEHFGDKLALKVYQSDTDGVIPEEPLRIEIDEGSLRTLTFLTPDYLGVGFDDPEQDVFYAYKVREGGFIPFP
jgi:hypothetical protein